MAAYCALYVEVPFFILDLVCFQPQLFLEQLSCLPLFPVYIFLAALQREIERSVFRSVYQSVLCFSHVHLGALYCEIAVATYCDKLSYRDS